MRAGSSRQIRILNLICIVLIISAGFLRLAGYRKSGESMADLMLSDGRIARVFSQREEWYLTVDGVDIEEIFDGMIFGG